MFSDELEMLIDAAIADGEITEKERAVLHKRAQAEGVDVDELDMIVDARIAKAKNLQVTRTESQNNGSVEENKTKEPTAAELLQIKIDMINDHYDGKGDDIFDNRIVLKVGSKVEDIKHFQRELKSDLSRNKWDKTEAIGNAIKNVYVPNEKHELLDMLLMCKKSFKHRYEYIKEEYEDLKDEPAKSWDDIRVYSHSAFDEYGREYWEKGHEVIDKIKSFFPNDTQLMNEVASMEKYDIEYDKVSKDIDSLREQKKEEFEESERMKNPIYRLKKLFGK